MNNIFEMELINKLANQYQKAAKKEKGKVLNKYCQLTKVKRNTASKRFRAKIRNIYPRILAPKGKGAKKGPKKKYSIIHQRAIKLCWELAGEICAERLQPMLKVYLKQLDKEKRLSFCSPAVIRQTKEVSLGTLKNIIATFPGMNKSKKKKGNVLIYKQVPIVANFGQFAKKRPGYVEVDYVEHSGGVSSGRFSITGCYIDLFSQWIARAAGWGKNQESVKKIDEIVHQKIHHSIIHYHPDNARPILKLLFEKTKFKKEQKLSRSRPYQKNDNAHVEQKNNDKIRRLVGYYRHDTQEEVNLLNKLYQKADLLDNFFIPSAKLKAKVKDNKGRVIKRIHDRPKTPYQRLLKSKNILLKTKKELTKTYQSLSMVKLRQEVEALLDELFKIQQEKRCQKH